MTGKGSNSVHMRHYNERVVLNALRHFGQGSKAEVARYAHLTPPSAANIIMALVDGGFVRENGRRFGGKGQPSVLYELVPDAAFAIGVHIGRRVVQVGLTGFCGQMAAFQSYEYDYPEPRRVAEFVNETIETFRRQLGPVAAERLVGIGLATPFFIGEWCDELGMPPAVQAAWRNLDLCKGFLRTGGVPIFVENDASAAAAAELIVGSGAKYSDFLHISLHTFVGGGLVIDGKLQTGPHGNSAALASLPVTPSLLNSAPQPNGKLDALLHRASTYALLNHLRFNGFAIDRLRRLDAFLPDAAPFVAEWQEDCAEALVQAIIGGISVVDVEAVIIDGHLARPLLLDIAARVRAALANALPTGLILPEIVAGTIGARGSAIGAGLLPIHLKFGPDTGVLTKKALDKKSLMVAA
jgi:predicted NBD/HSP70 family sugar kinase